MGLNRAERREEIENVDGELEFGDDKKLRERIQDADNLLVGRAI